MLAGKWHFDVQPAPIAWFTLEYVGKYRISKFCAHHFPTGIQEKVTWIFHKTFTFSLSKENIVLFRFWSNLHCSNAYCPKEDVVPFKLENPQATIVAESMTTCLVMSQSPTEEGALLRRVITGLNLKEASVGKTKWINTFCEEDKSHRTSTNTKVQISTEATCGHVQRGLW